MDVGRIIVDCIVGISLVFCVAYLVAAARKASEKRANVPVGGFVARHDVCVSYEDSVQTMGLEIFTDGLLLDKGNDSRLFVRSDRIVSLEAFAKDDKCCYKLEFTPGGTKTDSFVIISDEDILGDISPAIPQGKIKTAEGADE